MASEPIIVCKSCGSYQIERVAFLGPQVQRYHCASCGDEFVVDDPTAYSKLHLPNPRRCSRCDKEGVKLVERNYHDSNRPKDEVVDLHRCSYCGLEILMVVQKSRSVLYE